MSGLVDGATFALDAPTRIPPVWGAGQEVLWAQGEPLMICGPQGVGKSTLAQRLTLARIGIGDLEVLGQIVTPDPDRAVLYIAADRPNQIARSLRRMVTERDRRRLEGLSVWRGPLPFDITTEPDRLLAMAQKVGAGTVVVDSLKDIAMPLSEDRVGAAVNVAIQKVIAAGIEFVDAHHQRKATSDNKRPNALADVYGSIWLTSGHGSVVLLWGEPGDPVVELLHLKQPGDVVGPLELVHDHRAGTIRVHERRTARALVAASTNGGITVSEVAQRLHGPSPDRNQIEKARRKLDDLVRQGIAEKIPGDSPKAPARYAPKASTVIERDSPRDRSRSDHGPPQTPAKPHHASITGDHAASTDPPTPFRGRSVRNVKQNVKSSQPLPSSTSPNESSPSTPRRSRSDERTLRRLRPRPRLVGRAPRLPAAILFGPPCCWEALVTAGGVCARCGEPIPAGRQATARFCADECRLAVHAAKARASRAAARQRDAEQRRNRRLDELEAALQRRARRRPSTHGAPNVRAARE